MLRGAHVLVALDMLLLEIVPCVAQDILHPAASSTRSTNAFAARLDRLTTQQFALVVALVLMMQPLHEKLSKMGPMLRPKWRWALVLVHAVRAASEVWMSLGGQAALKASARPATRR